MSTFQNGQKLPFISLCSPCFKFYIWKTMYGVKALNEIYAFIKIKTMKYQICISSVKEHQLCDFYENRPYIVRVPWPSGGITRCFRRPQDVQWRRHTVSRLTKTMVDWEHNVMTTRTLGRETDYRSPNQTKFVENRWVNKSSNDLRLTSGVWNHWLQELYLYFSVIIYLINCVYRHTHTVYGTRSHCLEMVIGAKELRLEA